MQKGTNNLIPGVEIKVFPYKDKFPEIDSSVFVASGAKIIGEVSIGADASIWYNTVVRGDVNYIKIGDQSNIQDNSMLHVTNGKYPLNIGKGVTVGHNVTLHGCTLNDYCFIGMGAVVLDGAVLESYSMVAAGAVVRQNFVVPSGKLVAGVPAKIIRDLTEDEMADFPKSAERYMKYSIETVESLKKYNYPI